MAVGEMTVDERRKYVNRMRVRYEAGDRQERGLLLGEMEQVTEMHRKSLIRLLGTADLFRRPRFKEREREYGAEVDDAIRVVSESLDCICAERLKPALPEMARHLCKFGEMYAGPELIAQLKGISIATVGRILRRVGQDSYRLPRKGPQRTNQVARDIPMGRIPWDVSEPGHFEVDLVHHCGQATVGEYIHTLQMIDVATGWSERVAILGRSQREMEIGFKRIQARLPVPIIRLHPDNGSEFLNHHIIRCWKEASKGLELMRSRPFNKNDNRFVEQKNSSLVRAYLGKDRFDSAEQCEMMNFLYDRMWVYYNLFQPVMRLEEKQILPQESGVYKVKHKYDTAQTPFQRLSGTTTITRENQQKLTTLRDRTNPRQLRKEIYRLLDDLLPTGYDDRLGIKEVLAS
ncbi:MAG: integrase [Dehalococcoidia bacterium]|nr:integrase [Dehalococcoidia bacterium]